MAETIAETKRLLLRTWDAQDRADFVRYLNTPVVMRWLDGVREEAHCTTIIERLQALQHELGYTFWAVERKTDKAFLGFCGLIRVDVAGAGSITGDFEIGWRFREDAWGQGYAKEAAIATLDLAFGRFQAPHVVALTVEGNESSWRLMRRLGMKRREELDFDEVDPKTDLGRNIVYRIDAADWPVARKAALS
jgi:RimJ/RimL family protein N-acetyltransferase